MDLEERVTRTPQSKDEQLLARLGYKQELKRDFSWLELVGLSFSATGVVQSIASVLVYSIPNGGAVAMVWGWTAGSFFLMMIAIAMSELASAAPTSGGLYYWSFKFSSDRYRKLLSWIVGYSNCIGYISGFAGATYATSVQIFAAVTIGTGSQFIPTQGQIFALFCALVLLDATLSCLATRFIARIQLFYMSLNILISAVLIIALPIATPPEFKNSANYVFGNFDNLTMWPSGFAFLLSFLAPAWTLGMFSLRFMVRALRIPHYQAGIDTPVHMSEESRNASLTVPRTIIASTALACVSGWVFVVIISFNMGQDIDSILSNPIGQPMATIIFNSLGLRGTLAVWSFIIITLNMSCMNILVAASRQTFAFSRDSALPFSKWLYNINSYTGTPINCVAFCAFVAFLLALISFAGPAATGAIFTINIVFQYIAYSIPMLARYFGGREFIPGPFSLKSWSIPISTLAVGFMAMMIIILIFPSNVSPSAATMNYTVAVVVGILALSISYYFFPVYGGMYWFTGPVRTINELDSMSGLVVEKVEKDDSFDIQS